MPENHTSVITSISLLKKERSLIAKSIEGLSDEQLEIVPTGHRNNILWNLGHLVVVQQLLHYRLSRLETHISNEMIRQFRTGTSPTDWEKSPSIETVRQLLQSLPEKLEEDFQAGKFVQFHPYTTSTGVELTNLDAGLSFNHFHEGLHLGVILSIKKLVT